MRKLFHGSFVAIERPDASKGRSHLDFGRGFYLTSLRRQAERWARLVTERRRRDGVPVLNVYDFDDEAAQAFRWRRFGAYDLEWLDYVVACRAGEPLWKAYDIVEGGVANDNVIDTVEDYTMGIITAEQALGQLRHKRVNHQLCLVAQEAVDRCLRFVEAIPLGRGRA